MWSLAKTRLPRFATTPQVTISEAATQGYSTVAPPSGNIQPIRAFLPAFQSKEVRMSSNAKAVTLEELQKGSGGSFTIKPAVTIAAVGRRRFAYHSCVECRKKTNQNTEGRYGCVQHPTSKTKARYCLRIQLKQEDISMWSTAFHDVAESILGVSVEDFEELNDDQRRTVVWPAIGMKCNMTMRKTQTTRLRACAYHVNKYEHRYRAQRLIVYCVFGWIINKLCCDCCVYYFVYIYRYSYGLYTYVDK